jgi:hypothetical protein
MEYRARRTESYHWEWDLLVVLLGALLAGTAPMLYFRWTMYAGQPIPSRLG